MRKPTAYDVIRSPVITEKATMASEASQVIFNVAATATKPQIKAVNTLVRKGKKKAFRGRMALQGDQKRAIVTLADGHSIDVTTGV
jgi:large subunit ribosomal protein L23